MTGLFLPQRILEAIIAHAEGETPAQAYGILSGHDRIVHDVRRAEPGEDGPAEFSRLCAGEAPIVDELRAADQEFLAVYRSNPALPARPELEDLRLVFMPNVVYLILSLAQPLKPVLRGFRIHAGRIVEVPVTVFDDRDHDAAQDYVI